MRGHGRLLTAAGLITAGALAGCSGAAGTSQGSATATHELPPATPGTSAASPTATSSASTSISSPTTAATTATSAAAPAIPAAARAHTPEGAEAFTRYFIDQVNVAWTTPKTGLISALSLPTCKSCANLEQTAGRLADQGHRFAALPMTIQSVVYEGDTDKGLAVVRIAGLQKAVDVVSQDGQIVSTQKQEPLQVRQVLLQEAPTGWRIETLRG